MADPAAAERTRAGFRRVIETVNRQLDHDLGPEVPDAKTHGGLRARLAATVAACTLTRCVDHTGHRDPFAGRDPAAPPAAA